jgi:hypothetical protein
MIDISCFQARWIAPSLAGRLLMPAGVNISHTALALNKTQRVGLAASKMKLRTNAKSPASFRGRAFVRGLWIA